MMEKDYQTFGWFVLTGILNVFLQDVLYLLYWYMKLSAVAAEQV